MKITEIIRARQVNYLGLRLGLIIIILAAISFPNDKIEIEDLPGIYAALEMPEKGNGSHLDKIIKRDLSINPDPNYWDWYRWEHSRKRLNSNQLALIQSYLK